MIKPLPVVTLLLVVGAVLVAAQDAIQADFEFEPELDNANDFESQLDDPEVVLAERQEGEPLAPNSPAPCVKSFTASLRSQFCPSDVGRATFELLINGRLRVTINLVSGLRVIRAFLFIGSRSPNDNFENYPFKFNDRSFTTDDRICRNNRKVRIRIALVVIIGSPDSRDDRITASAVAPSTALSSGVSFETFSRTNPRGFFTVVLCECQGSSPPPCCPQNPSTFEFKCGTLEGFVRCTGVPDQPGTPPRFCFCGFTPDNCNPSQRALTCFASRNECPDLPPNQVHQCTRNSDCPAGQACQLASCCKAGTVSRNICNPLCRTSVEGPLPCSSD